MKITTVKISKRIWRRLNARKQYPGDTFENVIERMLDELEYGTEKPDA